MSHATSILDDGTTKRVKLELQRQKAELWVKAIDGGVKSTLDNHRSSINNDVDSIIDAFRAHEETFDDRMMIEFLSWSGELRSFHHFLLK